VASREGTVRDKKLEVLVEGILTSSSDDEALGLWEKITSEFDVMDVVWAHGKVSSKLVGVLTKKVTTA